MLKKFKKLQLKLTIEFTFFFIVFSGFIYFYFINSFEDESLEKFRYKARMISSHIEQNPNIFWEHEYYERSQLVQLIKINNAEYLVLENKEGKVLDAISANQNKSAYYVNTGSGGGISKEDGLFHIQLPIIANKLQIGKLFVGFNASETIADLNRRNLLIALFGLSILLSGIILTFFLSSLSFKPLAKIMKALDSSIEGEKNVKIDYEEPDEMGLLADKVNSVLTELDKSSGRAEVLNGELKGAIREKIREVDHEMKLKRRAEISLIKSENQFRLLFENAPIGMVIVSPEMKIEKVNKSFCDTLGYRKDELIGLQMEQLLANDESSDVFSVNQKQDNEGPNNTNSKHVIIRRDNTRIQVTTKSDTIYDEEKNPKHCIIQVLDITGIIKVQQELAVALEKANESNRLKSAFLAQMSHEIRTPLNVILPAIPILVDSIGEKDDDNLMILNSIGSASRRLQRTIDMILDMSALQSGIYKPDSIQIDLAGALHKLTDKYKSLANDKGLKLEFINHSTNPVIIADNYTVKQIFHNLLSNAIKYTNKGFVKIVIEDVLDGNLQVLVKDSGIGMNQEFMKNIFTPFSQEDVGQMREYEGNGLGLALVKKYSELNNAALGVHSNKGVGSTFSVTFNRDANIVKINDKTIEPAVDG
ncbi:ATP-binding protein [Bacteroidota bacterium]